MKSQSGLGGAVGVDGCKFLLLMIPHIRCLGLSIRAEVTQRQKRLIPGVFTVAVIEKVGVKCWKMLVTGPTFEETLGSVA